MDGTKPSSLRRTISDSRAFEEQQLRTMRALLTVTFLFLLIVMATGTILYGPPFLLMRGPLMLLLIMVSVLIALGLLRSSLRRAIWLMVIATLLALAVETIANGVVRPATPYLSAFSVPLVFGGLLGGRRALVSALLASVAVVAFTFVGEEMGLSWVGGAQQSGSGAISVLFFALVMGLVALALDRFGTGMREAHLQVLDRQREQQRLVEALEHEIEERKRAQELSERLLASEREARERAEQYAFENEQLIGQVRALNTELEARIEERANELNNMRAELETYTFSAAHVMRQPLRGIDGFAQLLIDDYGDRLDETALSNLRRIQEGAMQLGRFTEDILNLSRLTRLKLEVEPLDVTDMAGWVVDTLRRGEPDRQVEVRIDEGMTGVGDRRIVHTVLEVVIGNAWRFTRGVEGARIHVGHDLGPDDTTIFFVADNGIGFDMRYADKLFAPFQSVHPPGVSEGTGMGLALAQRILLRTGGTIWADSGVGEGSRFYFTLTG